MSEMEKLIIVGSGPAGYAAAIYAARAQLSPLVFEGSVEAGGALMNTTDVENYPGFPEGVQGPELMDAMRTQAERFGARLVADDVDAVKLTADIKGVKTSLSGLFKSRALIVASGSAHRKLGLPKEDFLVGKGVSYCGTCDGPFFKGLPVAVVGGGDSALEEALFLTKFSERVLLLVRRDAMRASKILQERVKNNPLIEIMWNTRPVEILGSDRVEALLVDTLGVEQELEVKGLFVAIGHEPRSRLFADYLNLDELGYITLDGSHGSTSTRIPGVFVAGDVADHRYRQAITAAGTGAAAALDAERWLEA